MVPIPSSGVPFMPKEAKSHETVSLFWLSKDKYIIESTIQNSGVPYSDTFNIKMQKTFETVEESTFPSIQTSAVSVCCCL
jgi:hypothetical protein